MGAWRTAVYFRPLVYITLVRLEFSLITVYHVIDGLNLLLVILKAAVCPYELYTELPALFSV